jgi:hypothetical protein
MTTNRKYGSQELTSEKFQHRLEELAQQYSVSETFQDDAGSDPVDVAWTAHAPRRPRRDSRADRSTGGEDASAA